MLRRLRPIPSPSSTTPLTPFAAFKAEASQPPPPSPPESVKKRGDENTTTTTTKNNSSSSSNPLARTIAELINGQPIPWPSRLQSSLSQLSPHVTRPVILRSLDLIKPPSSALRFFLWARSSTTIPLDDRAHFKMLQVVCRSKDLSVARSFLLSLHTDPPPDTNLLVLHDRFFNELIRAHAKHGQLRESVDLFRQMGHEFGVPPSVFTLNSLLSALLHRGRTSSARKLFEEMTQPDGSPSGGVVVSPDVCTFNTLIRGSCLNGMVDEGFQYFRDMSRWHCEPDVLTYNTLIDGLCRVGKAVIAHKLLDGMKNKGPGLSPNVVSYTTVIRGYCGKGLISIAMAVFQQMVSEGVKPNEVTYNTLLQGLCQNREMDRIKEIMVKAADSGFRPDTCTFNTLMTAHCNMGNVGGAKKMYDRMADMKVKPDSTTYSVLIRALCEKGDFVRAEELLDKLVEKDVLVKRGGCIPLMAAYNPMFKYLCRNGKTKKAGTVFRQLLKRSKVDVASFRTLILGYCNEGVFHDGYEILVTMVRRDLVPDEDTCQALIDGFLKKGEMEFAWKTLQKMLNSGRQPKTDTFHSVLSGLLERDGCAREVGDLIVVMLQRNIRQNINLSTGVAMALYKNGFSVRGFEIVRLLYDNGYSTRIEKLVKFVCEEQKFLEALELMLFSVEKHQNLDGEVYSTGILGLCHIGRASEAFRVFYELNEKGRGHIVSNCLKDLEVGLEKEGRVREAEFVCKRRRSCQTSTHHCK